MSRLIMFISCLGFVLIGMLGIGFGSAGAGGILQATTYTVTNTNDSGAGSLRQAIDGANANLGADLINITAGGTLQLLSPLPIIDDPVTIQGPGTGLFAIDGSHSFRVLDITTSGVTLADLTLQHGMVTGASENGAGIRSTRGLTLERVEVIENSSQSHGGGIYTTGDLTITDGGVRNNVSTNGIGGGLRTQGITTITGTQFVGNHSQGDGGGAFVLEALTLTNAVFQDNYCTAASCDGGGLFSFSQTIIDQSRFSGNTAQDHGGGAYAPGNLTVTGSQFEGNEAVFGSGGGVFAQGVVTIQDTHFLSNTARNSGGGVYALAVAELTGVWFENNQCTIGSGGGFHAADTLTLSQGQFIRNTALEGGGFSLSAGSASLVNTLFAENTATSSQGMAVLFASADPVELLHLTITGPSTPSGTAIELRGGSAEITNTVITQHAIGINSTGASVQQDFNLFFGNTADTQGNVAGGTNNRSGDPLFIDPAGDDYHLGMGSAAGDAGTNAGVNVDFEGDARPIGPGFDIGYDERHQVAGTDFFIRFLPMIQK